MDALPEIVFVHRDGLLLYVNPALLGALGYDDADELVGQDLSHAFVAPGFRDAFPRGDAVTDLPADVECLRRDGTPVQLQTRHAKVLFNGGAAWVVIARDVTAQRKLNERIIQTERMASVGTLAAGVAHEINNPLAAVMANLEFLVHEVRDLAAIIPNGRLAELEEVISDARLASDRIRRIVRGMRVFSRAEDERRVVLELPTALDAAIEMTQHLIRHRGRLVRDYQILPKVKADETQLVQVFINLLTNAAQALPDDRVAQNEVRVSAFTDERGRAVIEIRDNGQGIQPEVQRRIFDPFFTTKPVGVGTGLGLSIAHGVVSGIGGHIECESQADSGTMFRVVLPPVEDNLGASEPPFSASRLTRARVLVIDDEPQVGKVMRRLLGKDHQVEFFESASDALEHIFAGGSFDIAFCDVMMPLVSGEAFYDTLNENAPLLAERVVFITGGAFTAEARRFLERVPNQRLEKPFDAQQVRALVRASLVRRDD